MDGLGGVGNGFRLAEGKGIILTHVPITIQGINFISGGGADLIGDGESGVYSEVFLENGTTTITGCAFSNNENGCLVADVDVKNSDGSWTQGTGPGANVNLVLDTCDFGFNAANGITPDGLSHNFYCEGKSITVTNCNMYSAAVGNTQKCRGPLYIGIDSYIEAGAGRALDVPEGGEVTFTNCTMMVTPNSNDSALDYNSENTSRPWRLDSFVNPAWTGGTIIGTRNPPSEIWVNTSSNVYEFSGITQEWYSYGAQVPGFIPNGISSGGQSTFNSDPGVVSGLFLSPDTGGTVLTTAPVRPGSIAQPGVAQTPFVAWNGTTTIYY